MSSVLNEAEIIEFPHSDLHVLNKLTGEVYEFKAGTPTEIRDSWLLITETAKALERAKDKLKPKVQELVDQTKENTFPVGEYQFRVTVTQRMNYDKSVLRNVIKDQDLLDSLLMPDKTSIDKYLKENLEEIGEDSSLLRKSMVPTGNPYTTIRLERL